MIPSDTRYKKVDIELVLSHIDIAIEWLDAQLVYEIDEDNRCILEDSVQHLTKAYVKMESYYPVKD